MAYSDSTGYNARLLKRTVTGVTDFSGRSRRTEVAYYWIASTLISAVASFTISTIGSFETSWRFGNAFWLMLMMPLFALFVRRLHDQNRSGWWGLLLPLSLMLRIPTLVAELRGDVAGSIAQKTTPTGIATELCALAILVLCLMPGTDGANRYGGDPRFDEAEAS
jgi:uncharacterized membrane protein YhaH (DUF805 family)